MKNGIRNRLRLIVFAIGVCSFTSSPAANAQDNFREFDRKMVATPAELFEALSTFQPPRQRKEIDAQRQKEIEAAGREFLSKLSPKQQEKAWEFAEKYLRKNGVDSASSQKLMKDFGLPPEMQSELSKQFRKFRNRSSNSGSLQDSPDDAISQILRKARDKFDRDSQNQKEDSERADPLGRDRPETDADASDQSNRQTPQSSSRRNSNAEDAGDNNTKAKEQSSGEPNQRGQNRNSKRDASMNRRNAKAQDDSKPSQAEAPANPFELPTSRSTEPSTEADPNRQSQLPGLEGTQGKGDGSDVDLDQLLKRLGDLKTNIKDGGSGAGEQRLSSEDLNWERVIKNLAEKGSEEENLKSANPSVGSGGESGSSEPKRLDQGMFERAKELISGTFDPERKPDRGSSKRPSSSDATSNENVETRFDRLLVKAAQRSLKSGDKENVSKGVGSVLGNLIERIQNRVSNKDGEGADGQSSARPESGSNRNDRASSKDSASRSNSSRASNSDRSDRNSDSAVENPLSPPTSNSTDGNFDPRKMLDSISDLSAINPTHVFAFFAIVGVVLFVAYLLAQSFVGDEAKTSKRKVIQQIRSTKIKTPKDLVETVDTFLLGKFGIKSSWWNARLAQRVLNSGSPDFQSRVDDLIQDYIRARYMRDDIKIPSVEQQRYKKTLEELSALDIKADSNLGIVPVPSVPVLPAQAEG